MYRRLSYFIIALIASQLMLAAAVADGIHDAVSAGDVQKAKVLLNEDRRRANSTDEEGMTPLHVAALNGDKGMIMLLLQNKASINAIDRSGEVVAALNIGTHAARVTVGTMRSVMLPLMRRAQADLRLTL